MNTGAPWPEPDGAERQILAMQSKLHRWAAGDVGREFDDLYNLVYDPAFLVVALDRVRGNKGARTAGVDGIAPRSIIDTNGFLAGLREDLKARRFTPVRVREKMIPKSGGKLRRLGIPTVADRVVQAALKLVLEPIFEADFKPCSYGFRPKRRAQDAIAEIHYLASPTRNYEWVFEADIKACFDEIDHAFLIERVRSRVADKRILRLVKAFLRAGILSEDGLNRNTITGTPQGGILSPLLANIALSALDEHFARKWEELGPRWTRAKRRRQGVPTCRLVRYADDFVVMVGGTHDDAEALRDEVAAVLAPIGLRLSEEKTRVCHIDEGFDFLGFRIQRRSWRGRPGKRAVYTYPSKKTLASVLDKVRRLTRREKHRTLAELLHRLNPVLRGWCNYFRHGVCKRTFGYLDHFAWWRIVGWLRKRHVGINWGTVSRRYLPGWEIRDGRTEMFRPRAVEVTRYRYRGTQIPTPWTSPARSRGDPDVWKRARPVRRAGRGNGPVETPDTAPRSDPYTYLRSWEGVGFFSFVLDVYSRRCVGWQLSSNMRTDLVLDALKMALGTRRHGADLQLVHHSDRGSQYTSFDFTQALVDNDVLGSLGSTGDCYDNAMAESFVDSFKTELIRDRVWKTRTQLELAVVEWVGWYNHDRLHSALDHVPPVEYEALYARQDASSPLS